MIHLATGLVSKIVGIELFFKCFLLANFSGDATLAAKRTFEAVWLEVIFAHIV